MSVDEREFGKLEARLDTLEREMREIRSDMKYVRDAISQAKGGWKSVAWLIAVSGIFGALSGWLLQVFMEGK